MAITGTTPNTLTPAKNAETIYGQVLQGFQSNARAQAIADDYAKQRGAAEQSLVSRGLNNTTVKDSVMRGLLADQQKALLAVRPIGGGYSIGGNPLPLGQGGYGQGHTQHDDMNPWLAQQQRDNDYQKLRAAQQHQTEQMAADQMRFRNGPGGGGGGGHSPYGPSRNMDQSWGGVGGGGGAFDTGGYAGSGGAGAGGAFAGMPGYALGAPGKPIYGPPPDVPPAPNSPSGGTKPLDWNAGGDFPGGGDFGGYGGGGDF